MRDDMRLTAKLEHVIHLLTQDEYEESAALSVYANITDEHKALIDEQIGLKEKILTHLQTLPEDEQAPLLQFYAGLYAKDALSDPLRDFLYSFSDVQCAALRMASQNADCLFVNALRALGILRRIGEGEHHLGQGREQDLKIRRSVAEKFDGVIAALHKVVDISEATQQVLLKVADIEESAALRVNFRRLWIIARGLVGNLIVLFDAVAFKASTHTKLSMSVKPLQPGQDIQRMSALALKMSQRLPELLSRESDIDAQLRSLAEMMSSLAHLWEERAPDLCKAAPAALHESTTQIIQQAVEVAHRTSARIGSLATLVDERLLRRPKTINPAKDSHRKTKKATPVWRQPVPHQASSSSTSAGPKTNPQALAVASIPQNEAPAAHPPITHRPVQRWLQKCEAKYETQRAQLERLLRLADQQDDPDYVSQRCALLRRDLEGSTAFLQRQCELLASRGETPYPSMTPGQQEALTAAHERHQALLDRLNQPRLSKPWLIKNHPAPKASHWHELARQRQLAPLLKPTLLPAQGETLFRLKLQPKPEADEAGQVQKFPPVWLHAHVSAHFTDPGALFKLDYHLVSRAHLKSDHQSLRGQRWVQQHLAEHGVTELIHHSRALTQEEFNALRHYK